MKTSIQAMLKAGRMIGEASTPAPRAMAKEYLNLAIARCEQEQPSIEATVAAYSLGFQQGLKERYANKLRTSHDTR